MSEEPTKAVSPLRQRMIDDMRMRKLSDKTQIAYIRAVRRLARFLGRSPDTATAEDVRRFQLHLVDVGMSAISINATITALKFFFEATVGRPELGTKMRPVRVEHKLPVVLSREEVARLIEAAGNLKYRTALSVAYGAGLRASEIVSLKTTDVDSERMTLRIEQGKGHKDRYAMLPPLLLERLRAWWRYAHPLGQIRRGDGCLRARIPSTRWEPGNSTVPFTPPPRPRTSTSASRCIPCAIVSRLICSSKRRTSASSRSCSDTRRSTPPRSTPMWPPRCCGKW